MVLSWVYKVWSLEALSSDSAFNLKSFLDCFHDTKAGWKVVVFCCSCDCCCLNRLVYVAVYSNA